MRGRERRGGGVASEGEMKREKRGGHKFSVLLDITAVSQKRLEGKLHWGDFSPYFNFVNLLINETLTKKGNGGSERKIKNEKAKPKASYYSTIIGVGAY